MTERWVQAFVDRPPHERRQLHLVWVAMVLFLVHATFFSGWQIEDSAITFAFARNFATGEGFVANPGGTWVEGFSNPTFTLMLVVSTFFGLPPFGMAKLIGIGAGVLTLPLTWRWTRRLQQPGDTRIWPAFAPLLLAFSGPYVQWSAAGLENGVFNLFLAAGTVWLLEEGDELRGFWSAVPLGLLAWTRPDGPMYAGLITLLLGYRALRIGGLRWALGFVLVAGGPFLAWHLYAYQVFGWELPNTAYAKDPTDRGRPWSWSHRSWRYGRDWALRSTYGFFFPVFIYALTGLRGGARWFGHVAVVLGLAITLPGLAWLRLALPLPEEPGEIMTFRVPIYALVVALAIVGGLRREGRVERSLAAVLVTATLAFCVFTGGDWMKGFRWISFATVPLAVLAADGVNTVSRALEERGYTLWGLFERGRWAGVMFVPVFIAGIGQTVYVLQRSDTSPFAVQRRALFHRGLADRMHIDHVTHLEIDMGGNLYSSGFELTDIAGLVDVPIAHHGYQQRFIDDYIGRERRPLFVHIHGGWTRKSHVVDAAWFATQWVEIPGYAHSKWVWHLGTHIRRDAFAWTAWPYDAERRTTFGDLTLAGLHVPAGEVAAGGELYVELGWSGAELEDFRAMVFLSRDGDVVASFDLPPAYDWVAPSDWRDDRMYVGRHSLPVPEGVASGDYDVGLVVLNTDGTVRRAAEGPSDAVFVRGEQRWSAGVTVVSSAAAAERAQTRLDEALAHAADQRCEQAETAWAGARRHLARTDVWQTPARKRFESALADCWALRAEPGGQPNRALLDPPREAAVWIAKARQLDHHAPEVVRVSQVLADLWQAEGDRARDTGDKIGQWRGWRDALMADPSRSHLRRRTEDLRKHRLRLTR